MKASEVFRLGLQSLLARGLAATAIADRVGLVGASEVWGGDAPLDRPAWYLWLRDRAGVFRLDLEDAPAIGIGPEAPLVGRFSVRYYPSPTEPELGTFTPEERAVVAGGWLHSTGAPRIEVASRIPASFFAIGIVEWALDPQRRGSVLALGSLDRFRVRFEEPWEGEAFPLGLVRRDRGERTRDVPGWSLASPLFSALAGLHAQVERRTATRLLVARAPGFELVHMGDAGLVARDTDEVVHGDALLLFDHVGHHPGHGDDLIAALLDSEAETVADVRLNGCRGANRVDADRRLPVFVNDTWFGGEAHSEDRVACGC